MASGFTFYEFFCGGGMARTGLGDGWRCLFANDIDPKKAAAYRDNFGGDDLHVGDVSALTTADLPGRADLAWASFPCQDLSVAGRGGGLGARRSGAFWPFWSLIEGLGAEGRAPTVVVIENVCGLLTSHGGRDMAALVDAFAAQGYETGALVMDAERFVPQSRPRLFIVGVRPGAGRDARRDGLRDGPRTPMDVSDPVWGEDRIARVADTLSERARGAWRAWRLPPPPWRNTALVDLLEPDDAVAWDAPERTERLLALMAPAHRAKIEAARREAAAQRRPVAGAAFRRTRADGSRVEIRFDGVAGCLRTPAGGSSRQTLMIVSPDGAIRSRLLSGREAARLMGLPDSYRLPRRTTDALKLFGDGVAPPVVRHLAAHLLEPLLAEASAAPASAAQRRAAG